MSGTPSAGIQVRTAGTDDFASILAIWAANGDTIPVGGADIYRINLATREVVRLTHQEWTPNTAAGEWADDPLDSSQGRNYLGFGIYNAALADGDLETLRSILRRVGIMSEPGGPSTGPPLRIRGEGDRGRGPPAGADHATRGILIYEYLEGRGPPSIMVTRDRAPVGRCPQALADLESLCAFYNRLVERTRVSPLRIVTGRINGLSNT